MRIRGRAPRNVVVVTERQARKSARRALSRLGLTYSELEQQAAGDDFSSHQAMALWKSIGGTFSDNNRP